MEIFLNMLPVSGLGSMCIRQNSWSLLWEAVYATGSGAGLGGRAAFEFELYTNMLWN